MRGFMRLRIVLLAAIAATASAQPTFSDGPKPPAVTVSGLPSAASSTGKIFRVTDGASSSDCTTGSGSTLSLCISNGTTWQSFGGGGVTITSPGGTMNFNTPTTTGDVNTTWLATLTPLLNPGSGANVYTAGIKNTFAASATNPGLIITPTADPSSTTPGWLNIDNTGSFGWEFATGKRAGFDVSLLTASRAFKLQDSPGTLPAVPAVATLTDGATINWGVAGALIADATVTLGGNRTLALTGLVAGGEYVLKVVQDGTGSRGLTLGSGCTWKVSGGGAGAITPSTAAGAVDILSFYFDGTVCYANFNKNFS